MPTVTILTDNTVAVPFPKGLRGEWGFAAAVDDVLFDTGQSETAFHNANLLGIGAGFETIVLSHAHFDHTAGLPSFLNRMTNPTIYCHPEVWEPRYVVAEGAMVDLPRERLPIGMPLAEAEVENSAEVMTHRDPVEVSSGIYALGEIPRPHPDTTVGKIEEGDELVDDPVVDDQAIAIETGEGVGLILGCCHAGLLNTIEHAEEVSGGEVRYVLGGTHLVALDDEEVHQVADALEGKLDLFCGTHCTGFEAESILAERFPDAFRFVGVGSRIELPP